MREQVRTSGIVTHPALAISSPNPTLMAMSVETEMNESDRAEARMSGPHHSQ